MIDLDALTINEVRVLAEENGWTVGALRATGKTAQQTVSRGDVWVTVFYAEGRTRPLQRRGDVVTQRERLVRDLVAELTAAA